jgi:phosphoserine phosphatase
VREAADSSVTVPFLDAILFVLGIRREEIEANDSVPVVEGLPPF